MAGAPGRSGGARPGAGRPPKEKPEAPKIATDGDQEPIEFLLQVMNDNTVDAALRVRAAVAAAQYRHTKLKDGGVKDAQRQAAEAASTGRFAPGSPPKLVVNNS